MPSTTQPRPPPWPSGASGANILALSYILLIFFKKKLVEIKAFMQKNLLQRQNRGRGDVHGKEVTRPWAPIVP